MVSYNSDLVASVSEEASRILNENLLQNPSLKFPSAIVSRASLVHFSPDVTPFIPTPMKISESASALWAAIGLFATTFSEERFDTAPPERIEVDVYCASLMLFSLVLFEIDGKQLKDPEVMYRAAYLDTGKIMEPYRSMASNIYKTADGRYFHLHGSLNVTPTLAMLGLPQHRPDLESPPNIKKIKSIYHDAVGSRHSGALDVEANEHWRQPGVICYTVEEYAQTLHGRESIKEPLYDLQKLHEELPPTPWPTVPSGQCRPLSGFKVLDLTKVVAGPTVSRVLAMLGANVLRISTKTQPEPSFILLDGQIGKRDADINLKTVEGKRAFAALLEEADVVVDGFRPGALERLGFSGKWIQEVARRRGKGIVYCRENCYGWHGEWSGRCGYQQISDCVSGASWEQGKFLGLNEPVVPLLPNSDYQTGLVGAISICQALYERTHKGGSYNLDISLTQFNNWYIRDLKIHDKPTTAALQAKHPNFKPVHDTALFEMIEMTKQATMSSDGTGPGKLWDPAYWTTGEMRWGKDGEMARYLDWTKIISFRTTKAAETTKLAFALGSCAPGTDEPRWF